MSLIYIAIILLAIQNFPLFLSTSFNVIMINVYFIYFLKTWEIDLIHIMIKHNSTWNIYLFLILYINISYVLIPFRWICMAFSSFIWMNFLKNLWDFWRSSVEVNIHTTHIFHCVITFRCCPTFGVCGGVIYMESANHKQFDGMFVWLWLIKLRLVLRNKVSIICVIK